MIDVERTLYSVSSERPQSISTSVVVAHFPFIVTAGRDFYVLGK